MKPRIHATDVWQVLTPFWLASVRTAAGDPTAAAQATVAAIAILIRIIEGDSDDTALERIDQNVQRLLDESIKSGERYLRSARSTTIDPQRRDDYLMHALDRFTTAANSLPPPENIRAMTYAAVCSRCIGDEDNAVSWLKDAYAASRAYRNALIADVQKIEKTTLRTTAAYDAVKLAAVVSMVPMVGLMAVDIMTTRKHADRLLKLFDAEAQMRHLSEALGVVGVESEKTDYYFPANVHHVEKSVSKRQPAPEWLDCYDDQKVSIGRVFLGPNIPTKKRYSEFPGGGLR